MLFGWRRFPINDFFLFVGSLLVVLARFAFRCALSNTTRMRSNLQQNITAFNHWIINQLNFQKHGVIVYPFNIFRSISLRKCNNRCSHHVLFLRNRSCSFHQIILRKSHRRFEFLHRSIDSTSISSFKLSNQPRPVQNLDYPKDIS